ncbi:MAG: PHP-associated domain-containing protein [Anaerolineae bacterium]
MKADLHVHTAYSPDSLSTLPQIERAAQRRGLDVLAITDHNTIGAALLLARWSTLRIIVGEEIATTQGEIIGLFLHEEIPAELSPLDTVRAIKAQGGLVCIPHPCDQARRSSALTSQALGEVLPWVDMIEVLNARTTYRADLAAAEAIARRYGLARTAGSDAHSPTEIGRAYVELPAFDDARSFLAALAHGAVQGRLSSPLVHVSSTAARLTKTIVAPASPGQRYRSVRP